ncbi:hypothetical protein MANES_02G038800v8 [Manihot esculenta]|uniref:Uncharacterized protein n=1 Tax=Manihot esculenta TaxID=3983 RepID=A0ACB7I6F4_MANES|nr:hypothetical protein MANES_02G038800v8 [Manihot esculenta]
MVTLANNTLMHFEDLTLPSFQVIVMSGSIGCARCRQRVSQVIAKMTGLREYTVDVKRKQVIVKGDFGNQQKQEDDYSKSEMNKERGPFSQYQKWKDLMESTMDSSHCPDVYI